MPNPPRIVTPQDFQMPSTPEQQVQMLNHIASEVRRLAFGVESLVALLAAIHGYKMKETPMENGAIMGEWIKE